MPRIMSRRHQRIFAFLCPVILFLGAECARAQQSFSHSRAVQSQLPRNAQPKKTKTPAPQKKSDIEKQTGTVNDRIFEAMPNYVVEDAMKLPPLKAREKFGLATAAVFDPFTVPFVGFLAALDQANNSPKAWGQGWGAYGKRFGMEFGDNGIGTYMTVAIFPTVLHEDPRYYVLRSGTFSHRAAYAVRRLFLTYTDSGSTRFNYSEIAGNAAAAAASNIYHAPEDRTVSRNLTTWGMLIMWDGISNETKEFWPDIRRAVFHRRTS